MPSIWRSARDDADMIFTAAAHQRWLAGATGPDLSV
jgi:hypothetical protein